MSYRDLIRADGSINRGAIIALAHRRAAAERDLAICVAAGIATPRMRLGDVPAWRAEQARRIDVRGLGVPAYRELFGEEMKAVWAWAIAQRDAWRPVAEKARRAA
jgi:hypothetical protein